MSKRYPKVLNSDYSSLGKLSCLWKHWWQLPYSWAAAQTFDLRRSPLRCAGENL